MNEPDNHTAWVDRFKDTWIRVDEHPGQYGGTWWPLTDGPGWEPWARSGVGKARDWEMVEGYGPFTPADAELAERALIRVREEVAT